MQRNHTVGKRLLAMLLCICMVVTWLPRVAIFTAAAGTDPRSVDASTMDIWKYFLESRVAGVELTTEYAGGVWTDKSVFSAANIPAELTSAVSKENTNLRVADTGENFLVALSAIASNKEIVGYSTIPTDTVFVLDMSSSMRSNDESGGSAIDELVVATNKAIKDLLDLNKNNRVAVVLYAGNVDKEFTDDEGITTVLLPLDSYTTTQSGTYLQAITSDGNANWGIRVASSVRNSNDQSVSGSLGSARGTFMQDGVYEAMKVLLNTEDTTVESGIQAGTTRLPIMVLMTDGEPTMANNDYNGNDQRTDLGTSNMHLRFNDQDYNHRDTIAFMTQLTTAYAKREVTQHYGTEALVYTLAFGEEVNRLEEARSVMDPANTSDALNEFWTDFLAGEDVRVFTTRSGRYNNYTYTYLTVQNDTAEPLTTEDKLYVNEFFPAETIAELNQAFQSIVDEIVIQSKYYPTYVEKDHDHDGYITFTDKIGGYMEVKSVKGFVIGDHYFSGATLAAGFQEGNDLFGSIQNPNAYGDSMVRSVKERLGIESTSTARALLQDAFDHGQLSYTSNTQFSNYIGWYSDADGKYIDFWHEGLGTANAPAGATHIVKSYGFLGETDAVHGISDTDMLYASVRVSKELTDYDNDGIPGETMLIWQLPASLIPTITYEVEVEVDSQGSITDVKSVGLENPNVKPIRLLYEVGLQDGIYDWNVTEKVDSAYASNTANKDAGYVFYTNQWKKGGTAADAQSTQRNTYSHYEPSLQNERYYYTENTPICTDQNGTVYTAAAKPDPNGTYYREFKVFEKMTGGSFRMHNHYEKISSTALSDAIQVGGQWFIPKGEVHRSLESFTVAKSDTTLTNTLGYSFYPSVVSGTNTYYSYSTLGNNGKLVYTPATGFKLTKTLETAAQGAADSFTFEIAGSGTATLVRLDATGDEKSRETLTFTGGKAEVTLEAGETVYIIDLTAGATYTVTEKADEYYKVSQVLVNNTDTGTQSAVVTAQNQTIQSVEFVNAPKGYGNLFITKEIVSDHNIPADIASQTFEVAVNVGADLATKTYEVARTGATATYTGVVDASGLLKINGENLKIQADHTYEILGLPEGTQVTVTEMLTGTQSTYFAESIKTRDHSGAVQDNDGIVTITAQGNATAVITNTYDLEAISVPLDVAGSKVFEVDSALTDSVTFDFEVQKRVGDDWVTVSGKTASVTFDQNSVVTNNECSDTFTISDVLAGEVYDTVGAYAYQVVEKIPDVREPGVTYDRSVYTFTVTVTDENGQLAAKVTDHAGAELSGTYPVSFRNAYHSAPVSVDIQKEITNTTGDPAITAAGFAFTITETDSNWNTVAALPSEVTDGAGEARFAMIYDVEGDYYYIIREKIPAGATLVADGQYAGKYLLNGWYWDPTVYYVKVTVTQQTSGDMTAVVQTGTDPAALSGSGDAAAVNFHNIYDPADAEVDLDIVPTVRKHLQGRPLNAGEFTFYVVENGKDWTVPGNILATGTNDANGDVSFDKELRFDSIGKFDFDVVEKIPTGNEKLSGVTYDPTIYDMVVEVSDNGDGTLSAIYYFEDAVDQQVTFHNVYTPADTTWTATGSKKLTGRPMLNAEFEFVMIQVTDETGNTAVSGVAPWVAENTPDDNHDGTVPFAFPAITYTAADAGKTYYYKISETEGKANGVEYDGSTCIIKVEVIDNGDGTMTAKETVLSGDTTFENKYTPKAIGVELAGLKNLDGKDIADYTFSFRLTKTDASYNPLQGYTPVVVQNDPQQHELIPFGVLSFSTVGDYYYLAEEIIDNKDGIVCDTAKFQIHITITDDHQGSLQQKTQIVKVMEDNTSGSAHLVALPVSSIVFNNYYDITGNAQVTLEGTKTLTGRPTALQANEFTFELYTDETGYATTGTPVTVNNEVSGAFDLTLNYGPEDAGKTYYYVLKEYEGDKSYITYSDTEYRFKVQVEDNGLGGIMATVSADNTLSIQGNGTAAATVTGLNFENIYKAAPVDYTPEAQKVYEGDSMKTFDFVLSGAGFQTQTKQNDAQGKVVFDKLTFENAGTYIFTVKEQENILWGFIKWDTNVYELKIEVTDDGSGQLKLGSVVITDSKGAANGLVFRNVHKDIITEKAVDKQIASVGEVLTYTISYTNTTGTAADVVITDKLDSALSYVAGSAAGGVYENGTITWTVNNVPADETVAVSFQAKINANTDQDKAVNVAQIIENKTDVFFTNETVTQLLKPALTILKEQAVGNGAATTKALDAEIGDTVTYTLTVTNNGKGVAQDITVSDKFPEGLAYVAASASNDGKVEDGTVTWKLASLASGESVKLSFKVKVPTVTKDTAWTNVATAVYANNPEGDKTVESNKVVITAKIPVTPDTGDNFCATLFISLMVISSFGIAAIMVCKKREEAK